jgi:hypothetical protein
MQLTGPAFLLSGVESRWKPTRQLILGVMQRGIFNLAPKWKIKDEDYSFSPDDAPVGCRIGAAKTNYGLRAGQRTQNVL